MKRRILVRRFRDLMAVIVMDQIANYGRRRGNALLGSLEGAR